MEVEAAIRDALKAERALCKVISRNDVGATGTHQCGFYLPKAEWWMFASASPVKGTNHKTQVRITWPHGIVTNSVITWYGQKTRSEYRLTRFDRGFPWLHESFVGSLFVLVPIGASEFRAHILDTEAEIELLQAALGIEMLGGWSVYIGGRKRVETEDECLRRVFRGTVEQMDGFPSGDWMATRARSAVQECAGDLSRVSADARLLKWIAAEYQLFRALEQKLAMPAIQHPFREVDEFIEVAATVMNRRKSRAGHSLEHHVEELLVHEKLPFDRQPRIDGKVRPDLLIPGKAAYENPTYPVSRLVVAGLKTTCKDRWRQVLSEGKRVPEKHLLTLQEAISRDQLVEMRDANVTLVVPQAFHRGYDVSTGIQLLTVEGFITKVKILTKGSVS